MGLRRVGRNEKMRVEVVPASSELETRPDVMGYTSELLAREERALLAFARMQNGFQTRVGGAVRRRGGKVPSSDGSCGL